MAERRMFAKSVIGSARFLRMPPTSRLLYYDLGMQADDDGVVEAFSVMRTTGANEDDLRVLASKGFVTVLNEDLVTYIQDWSRNNLIKKDRYHASVYSDLLVQLNDGNSMEPVWNPSGTQTEPEVRLGKVSIGESTAPPAALPSHALGCSEKSARKKYGQYGWVKLTDEEYNRLLNDLGQAEVERCIAYIDESAQSTGNKNKWRDWNLVVRRCHRDGWGLGKAVGKSNSRDQVKTAADYESGDDFLKKWNLPGVTPL